MAMLYIHVLSATNVPTAETFGKSDPYVRLEFRGQSYFRFASCDAMCFLVLVLRHNNCVCTGQEKRTEVKKSELSPTFNEV